MLAGATTILSPIRANLDELRTRLGAATLPPNASKLVDQTLELIDRNLERIGGRTPAGAVVGYGNYPDYAELGRIRTNVSLIRMIAEDVEQSAAGTKLVW